MRKEVRDNGHRKNIFDKVNEIKQQLKEIFPEVESDRFLAMFSHCRRHHEGKLFYGRGNNPQRQTRDLTQSERVLYDFLLRNKLNPTTVYRWFLATRIPEDVKQKLADHKIGYKTAMRISYNRKKARDSNIGLIMVEEIRNIVRGLY